MGGALVDHHDVDKLSFTGSTAVGREIAKQAGDHLTAVTLELGGKSPNVIFPSADLENAINGLMKDIFAATGPDLSGWLAGPRPRKRPLRVRRAADRPRRRDQDRRPA